ncbi:MAG: ECF transporter S component [Candidatus Faecousia sp.]|nr:energy-coupled thiamine transporter ThiT [Clostridiales bacterium]MDY6180397.1 ECF transporter S component [Candidatus Faecousia sp.]
MKNGKIKRMVGIGLLMALVVVMQLLSGVIPPVAGFSISLVLIPIVLGSAAFGPGAGALLGATFGLVVFINCVTGADPGGQMVFQAGPVLCFLVVMAKGTLAGFGSGLVYKLLSGKNPYLAMLCAAIVCPVINTGVFVACMFAFFIDVLSVWAGGTNLVGYVLSGLILMNFLPELAINVVFSPAGQRILHAVKK